MTDLFTTKPRPPLAELLRPRSLDEFVGQQHLLGPGKPLRLAFESGRLHSFILWGPPGVGKTTLGRLAARATDSRFIAISAVLAGVKDIRQAIDEAQAELDNHGRSTVLFVDEIHRFNKAQQDALLPHVESGLLTLVGGTTEHPGLAVNSALLSRAQVYMREHFGDDLRYVVRQLPHHPHGLIAARASEAASNQGMFWPWLDFVFTRQHALEREDLIGYAAEVGLDVDRFIADLDSAAVIERVERDIASAVASGAHATPTFFVEGRRLLGSYDARTLTAALEASRRGTRTQEAQS